MAHDGKRFLIGFEESDGYLRGTYVRDKDGLVGMLLICELAAYYKSRGMDLVDALQALYDRYGYEFSDQLTVVKKREDGKNASSALMSLLRDFPPKMLGDCPVCEVVDYSGGASMPVVGGHTSEMLPPSDVLEWRLENGSKIIVRPSGTEPKLKAYVFARGQTEKRAQSLLKTLCEGVEALLGDECPNQ
jgi:phosphoglucomutase